MGIQLRSWSKSDPPNAPEPVRKDRRGALYPRDVTRLPTGYCRFVTSAGGLRTIRNGEEAVKGIPVTGM